MENKYFNYYNNTNYSIIELCIDNLNLFETPKVLDNLEIVLKNLNYPDIIVDLKNVTSIDSAGLGFLIAVKNILSKKNKEMLLICNTDRILAVMKITKMNSFFQVFNNIDEAIAYFNKKYEDS